MVSHRNADVVLITGNVITINPRWPRAEAIAIRGGKLIFVGKQDRAREFIGSKTEVWDLKGATVVPGFNDAHTHTLLFGLNLLRTIDLTEVRSIDEIVHAVRERTQAQTAGTWILGFGYNHNELKEKRHPTRRDLDAAAPNHPVSLKHCAYHMQAINSKALALAGITRETLDPGSGKIGRDEATNEPTGVLYELPAIDLVERVIPKPSREELRSALKEANRRMIAEGITSATDATGAGLIDVPSQITAFREAVAKGDLTVRHSLGIWSEGVVDFTRIHEGAEKIGQGMKRLGVRPGQGDERLRFGPLKIVADGALTTATAATYEPYGADPSHQSRGMLLIDPLELRALVGAAVKRGWQVSIHSIGDRAIDAALDAIEKACEVPKGKCRHRIDHCTITTETILKRMNKLRVMAILQPGFIWELGDGWIRQLGPDRAMRVKPFRTILDNGIVAAFSSDRPVIKNAAPLIGIHTAVNEKTMTGQIFAQRESISPEEALRCYTLHGAYATFEENMKGSIQKGKLADLAVLSDDPTRVPSEEIKDIKVRATIIEGQVVYGDGSF